MASPLMIYAVSFTMFSVDGTFVYVLSVPAARDAVVLYVEIGHVHCAFKVDAESLSPDFEAVLCGGESQNRSDCWPRH